MITQDQKLNLIQTMEAAWQAALPLGIHINKAVLFAQAAHESAWGLSQLFRQDNNPFGIKAGSAWQGKVSNYPTWEEVNGQAVQIMAPFRHYKTLADAVKNYSDIINYYSWYADALPYVEGPDDQFLRHILASGNEPGWATDSGYFDKVKAVGLEIRELGGPRWG